MKGKIVGIGIILVIVAGFFSISEKKSNTEEEEPGQHPGWVDHYRELKGDENGNIPQGLAMKWYKADLANKALYKKAEDNLENIQEIGPFNVGGRTRSIVVDYSNPSRLLCAGVSGGIWVSENAGTSWDNVNDFAPTLSATAITQSPFNNDLFYYGTGESFGNSADLGGLGLFKSEDGAETFQHLEHTMTTSLTGIWDVEHSLVYDSTIYVATHSGGLWRSTDAAQTFTRIYSSSTRIHEIEVQDNGHILIAVNGFGIVDIDEVTLEDTPLTGGEWPASGYGRISFDYVEDYPQVMYAQLATSDGVNLLGVYKTSNGGTTWTELTYPDARYNQAWYDFKLSVAPSDSSFVISTAVTPTYSDDGGITWLEMANPHADYHEITWEDDNTFLIGNDGGVFRMQKNSMGAFTNLNNGLNITQFYAGHFYPSGNSVVGGTQDNGTRFSNNGIPTFSNINGGDGAFCSVHQQNDNIRYVSSQYLNMKRQNSGNTTISTFIRNEVGGNDGVWFINPFEINMLDGDQIYVPTRHEVYRSLDQGDSWIALTGDLFGESFSVGLSNSADPIAYIGGTASRVYYVKNAATAGSGEEVALWDAQNLPSDRGFLGGTIGCIEVDPNDETTIYCGFTNIDTDSRIWRIRYANTDSAVFDDIGSNLPESVPVNWVEVDPDMSEHILVGTDYGLYTTLNGGQSWQKEDLFPNAPIDQIRLRHSDRKLYIYTHGRGIWTADLKDNLIASTKDISKPTVSVYPNPASDYITISGEQTAAKLYNLNGEIVARSSNNKIDVSSLSNGTYFVEIVDAKGVEKIIVTH